MSDPHAYFRYVSIPFSRAVCYEFGTELRDVPSVNLHGDAHLEQYAVTDAGRGLTDFDDSSWGPPVIDLVRFGVSLRLAGRARGWQEESDAALGAFLDAYIAALHDDDVEAPEPAFVARLEAKFSTDRRDFLEWAASVSPALSGVARHEVEAALAEYIGRLRAVRAGLPPGFFDVKRVGSSSLGVGSASDEKYVLQVEGPSDAPEDDVVLEAKEIRSLEAIPCVRAGAKTNPFRILVGRVHVPYDPYLGYFMLRGKDFWVHAWQANYQELEIDDPLLTPEDLKAVAFETGVQLARAHLQQHDGSSHRQLGHRAEHAVEEKRQLVREAIGRMTAATLAAWERFRTDAGASPASDGPGNVDPEPQVRLPR